jgi:hypothetical protein
VGGVAWSIAATHMGVTYCMGVAWSMYCSNGAPSNTHAHAHACHPCAQVGLTKTKDALSVAEDRAKQLGLDLQRMQMDLIAKTSESGGLGTALRLAEALSRGV